MQVSRERERERERKDKYVGELSEGEGHKKTNTQVSSEREKKDKYVGEKRERVSQMCRCGKVNEFSKAFLFFNSDSSRQYTRYSACAAKKTFSLSAHLHVTKLDHILSVLPTYMYVRIYMYIYYVHYLYIVRKLEDTI